MPKTKKPKPRKKSIQKELAALAAEEKTPADASQRRSAPVSAKAKATETKSGPLRLEWRSPDELAENPLNWRRHPAEQVGALAGAIADVGWAGACLFNEATGRLIDGHARRKLAIERGEKAVPVLIGSWTEEQEKKILAMLDPLSAMAVADPAALAALLAEVDTECADLQAMLDGLAVAQQEQPDADPPPADDAPKEVEHVCPNCGTHFLGGQLIQGEEK